MVLFPTPRSGDPAFRISFRALPGLSEHAVLILDGEFDLVAAEALDATFTRAADRRPGGVLVLDLRQTTFLDSTGLGAIVALHQQMARTGGSLRIAVGAGAVRRLLALTHVDTLVPTSGTVEEALGLPALSDSA